MNHWMKNGNVYQGKPPSIMNYVFNPDSQPMPQNHMPMKLAHWSNMPQCMRSPYSNPHLYHQQFPFPMIPRMIPIHRPSSSIPSSIVGMQLQAHSNELAVELPTTDTENNSLPHKLEETAIQNNQIPVTQQQMFGIDGNIFSIDKSNNIFYTMNGIPGPKSEYINNMYSDPSDDIASILNADVVGDFTTVLNSNSTSDLSANLTTNLPTELPSLSTDVSPSLNNLTPPTTTASGFNGKTECPGFPPVRDKDITGEQVPLAEREFLQFTEASFLNDIAYEIEVETSPEPQQEQYNVNIGDNQIEGSNHLEKNYLRDGNNNSSFTPDNNPRTAPNPPFDNSGDNSRLNIKMVPGVQEKVLKAAKSLFNKRTTTLYHWLYPEISKTSLKALVTGAWDTLPENQKNLHVSQVLGRFGLQGENVMINPQLSGMNVISPDPSNNSEFGSVTLQKSCEVKSVERTLSVEDLSRSYDDSNGMVPYLEPQRKSENKRINKSSHTTVHQKTSEDDQSTIAKRLRIV